MRACIQRVSHARVSVEGELGSEVEGEIGRGLLVLLGVATADTDAEMKWLAEKIVGLRIFDDPDGKMNLSLTDIGGSMLVVSQFTLYGDCRKGRRPSFIDAAPPEMAEAMYEKFVAQVAAAGIPTATGRFRTTMAVELTNDGPVTIWIDTVERNVKSEM
jgi:D-tyrosyl-tRNA(Tyr) deacylase